MYKVVRMTCPGLYSSLYLSRRLAYAEGQKTVPSIGKIFCFRSKKNAINYMKQSLGSCVAVISGMAENPKPMKFMSNCEVKDQLFWEIFEKDEGQLVECRFAEAVTPEGTFVVDSFTTIELVKIV